MLASGWVDGRRSDAGNQRGGNARMPRECGTGSGLAPGRQCIIGWSFALP